MEHLERNVFPAPSPYNNGQEADQSKVIAFEASIAPVLEILSKQRNIIVLPQPVLSQVFLPSHTISKFTDLLII